MIPTLLNYKELDNLSEKKLNYLCENKEWYPKGIKAHFMLMIPQGVAAAAGVSSVFQPGFTYAVATYTDKYMRWSYDPRDFKKISGIITEKIENGDTWHKEYLKDFWNNTQHFKKIAEGIFLNDSDRLNIKEGFIELLDALIAAQSYGYITEIFTLTSGKYWVTEFIKKYAPQLSDDDIKVLLIPSTKSFIQQFQDELRQAKDKNALENVQSKYYWVKGSYYTLPELTQSQLEAEQTELLAKSQADHLSDIQKKKKEILASVDSSILTEFVTFVEAFIAMQDERKANVLRANYSIQKLLNAFAKQNPEWNIDILLSLSPTEFINVCEGRPTANLKEKITKRNARSVWVCENSGYFISTDDNIVSKIEELLTEKSTQEIKGFVASKGIAKGTVRVVFSEEDFHKVQKGDILVTSMTRPEFMPVLEKAAAFITNEGGITCHAAIVSREMKKPCIIGTKTATQVLKDGDMVEVDANTGVVKIIK
jgi:phosphohistidine swiveling domain-containing protein